MELPQVLVDVRALGKVREFVFFVPECLLVHEDWPLNSLHRGAHFESRLTTPLRSIGHCTDFVILLLYAVESFRVQVHEPRMRPRALAKAGSAFGDGK